MLTRALILFLALTLVSTPTSAGQKSPLKAAFDQLSYSLTVEWDQRDRSFYDARLKDFADKLSAMQAQGTSKSELVAFALAQVKDKKLSDDLNAAYAQIRVNQLSQSEARKQVLETISQALGASWSGQSSITDGLVALLLVVAVVAAVAVTRPTQGGACSQEKVCEDYYTQYGAYWYSDCYTQSLCN